MHEIRVEAAPDVVFAYFTDPERMVRWMGVAATLDPRPGGVFRVDMVRDSWFEGRYLVVEPPHRIVFSWGYGNFPEEENPLAPGASTVEVELVADGAATIVRLRHELPSDLAEFHAMGWEHYLGRLTVAAAGADPGPDEMREVMEEMLGGWDA